MSRPHRSRLGLTLVAAALLTLFLAVFTPRPATAALHEISVGELNWGLKESWRNYVGGAAVSEGATLNPDGTTKYPLVSGSFDDETNTTELVFGGQSWYRAWWEYSAPGKWALDTTVKDLKIVISPTEQVLRGTIIGYSQDDPGGELHTDIDVVLAQLVLDDNEGITFADGKSTFGGLATRAAMGLGLYSAGTPLDRVTFTYDGPGGLPETGEKFSNPGEISLVDQAEGHLSDWDRESHAQSNRQLFFSPDGEQLDFIEMKNGTTPGSVLRFTRLDADSLEPVGDRLEYTDFPTHGSSHYGRYFRIAQNPDNGDIFFVLGGMGEDRLGTWVHRARWDADQEEYAVEKIGELPDAAINGANVINTAVGPVVWNEVEGELQVFADNDASTDLYDRSSIYRFSDDGSGWQRTISVLRAPDTGQWAGANQLNTPWSQQTSGAAITTPTVAIARDGSLILPSKTASARYPDPLGGAAIRELLPSAQIKFDGAQVEARYIPGTMVGNHPTGTYYGWTNASSSADGSVYIHNSQWGLESFVRVDIVAGDAQVVGPIYRTQDIMPPYEMASLGRMIAPDPGRGWDWVVDVSDPDGFMLNAFRQVDGEDVMFSRHRNAEFIESAAFGTTPLVRSNGDVYLVVRDADTQRAKVVRMEYRGVFAKLDETPEPKTVSLDTGEESETVTFRSTVEGGEPAPTRQWQVKRAGESAFTDIEGETGEALEVEAVRGDDGSEYRAVYTSDAGRIATDPAELEVLFAPSVVNEPADVNVTAGKPATLVAMPAGNPLPHITWQIRLNGIWQNVDLDNGQFTASGEHGGFLAISDTNPDMDGLKFRARLRNKITPGSEAYSTTYSRTATLSVSQVQSERVYFDPASSKAEWGVSERFRCYVTGNVARGWIEVEDGAEQIPGTTPTGTLCSGNNSSTGKPWGTGGEAFRFGLAKVVFPEVGDEPLSPVYDPETGRLRVDLGGKVRFQGHDYHTPGDKTPLLKTEISNIRIEANLVTGDGFVIVDAVGANMDNPEPSTFTGIKLAYFDASGIDLSPVDGRVRLNGVPTFLHQEGLELFGNYPVGEPMDPLALDLAIVAKPARPVDPVDPPVKAAAPKVKRLAFGKLKARTAVARVTCPAAASGCRVKATKRVRLKASGKLSRKVRAQLRRGVAVAVPAKVAAGRTAKVTLRLNARQRKLLKGRKVVAKFQLVSRSVGGDTDRRTITVRGKVG